MAQCGGASSFQWRLVLSVLAVCALAPQGATGQTGVRLGADDAYLAARRAAVAKIKKRDAAGGEVSDAQTKQETRMTHELEGALRHAVGAVKVDGFGSVGHANLEALSRGDLGFGVLDALVFNERRGTTSTLFVTTDPLLQAWLKEHEKGSSPEPDLPQTAEAAVRIDGFYTQAISADAAVSLYGDVPVDKPATAAMAVAQLESSSQDQPPPLPDQLVVSVEVGGRFFLMVTSLKTPFAPIPACDTISAAFDKKIQALDEAREAKAKAAPADAPVDEAAAEAVSRLREQAGVAALRCVAAHAKEQPAFAAARAQAQSVVALLAR